MTVVPLRGPARARGFSLIELAVVLAVLGLLTVALLHVLGAQRGERMEDARRELLRRADDAVLAFAMVNGRLPCPAPDRKGVEECSTGQVGFLPFRTLGLPDARAGRIRYGVYRRDDANPALDGDLARRLDRFRPLQVVAGNIATELPLNNVNGLDLCWAVRTAQRAPLSSANLHLRRPDAPGTVAAAAAYALALPAAGERFSGAQRSAAPAFDSPRRPRSPSYDDLVQAVGLDQLWARMRCGDHLAAAGHAHFNAAAAAAVMDASLSDYKQQLAVAKKLAEANLANAGAGVANATGGMLSASAGVADAIAESIATAGGFSWRVGLAVLGIPPAVAALISSSLFHVQAKDALDEANKVYSDVDSLILDAGAVKTSVQDNAEAADARGTY